MLHFKGLSRIFTTGNNNIWRKVLKTVYQSSQTPPIGVYENFTKRKTLRLFSRVIKSPKKILNTDILKESRKILSLICVPWWGFLGDGNTAAPF